MDVQHLINQLHHAHPHKRIEALRVLAMVEETRALNAIGVTVKDDPDEQVRQVAQWAGKLILQAQQRGHSTEKAIQSHFGSQRGEVVEELLVKELLDDTPDSPDAKNQMAVLQKKWEHLEALPREEPAQPPEPPSLPSSITEDDMALLDAGLSELFRETM